MGDAAEIENLEKVIADLRIARRKLMKRKFRLETKISIPAPITFKEYEEFIETTLPSRSLKDTWHNNVLEKLNVHSLVGIKYLVAEEGKVVVEMCFAVGGTCHRGFNLDVQYTRNEGYRLVASNLPHGLEVQLILEKVPIKTDEDLRKFFQYLHICGCAFFDRKEQCKDLLKYIEDRQLAVDLFVSSNVRYVEIKLTPDLLSLDLIEKDTVRFFLTYSVDCVLPLKVIFDEKHLSEMDKSRLNNFASYFMTLSLKEAFRCIKHYKAIKQQPPENSLQQQKRKTISQSKIIGLVEIIKPRNKVFLLSEENESNISLNTEMQSSRSNKKHQGKSIKASTFHAEVTGRPEKDAIKNPVQSKNVNITPHVSSSRKNNFKHTPLHIQPESSTPLSQHKSNRISVPANRGNLQKYFPSEDLSSISSIETIALNYDQVSLNVNPLAVSTPFPNPRNKFHNLPKEPENIPHRPIKTTVMKHSQSFRQPTLQEILKPPEHSQKKEKKKTGVVSPNKSSQSGFTSSPLSKRSNVGSIVSASMGEKTITQDLRVTYDFVKKKQMRRKKEKVHDREEEMEESADDEKNEKRKVHIQDDAPILRSLQVSRVIESDESEEHEESNQKTKYTIPRDSHIQKSLQSFHEMSSDNESDEDEENNQEKNIPSHKRTIKLLEQMDLSEEESEEEENGNDQKRKVTVHKDTPVRRSLRQLHLKTQKVKRRQTVVTDRQLRK